MKSTSPPSHGLSEGKEYSLRLGTSFEKGSRAQESFHVLRYDFKPASIDTSQPAELTFGSNKECVVTYPNQDQGSTTFKGGRKPGAKECILIIDKETGDITLERVSTTIPLKKSRSGTVDRSAEMTRKTNTTPVSLPRKKATSHSSKHKSHDTSSSSNNQQHDSSQTSSGYGSQNSAQSKSNVAQQQSKQPPVQKPAQPKDTSGSSSSDSSSDSDSSDSDSDVEEQGKVLLDQFNDSSTPYEPPPPAPDTNKGNNILQDLQLSDSNSDSDSD
ncbi:ELL-associated factor 2-like [Clytia hemisphaerica]|uniref:Transcription elongation factor Eaf N-terminal domain-containing protein n=1 Tax=Clytia hemisphaerica TaxID=252671 RepID=A0A7M5UYM9_9CNID|eukprot:TCONS_00034980-protein